VPRFLIVNADDFNLTEGVTRGILEAHRHGIVTSASVMVNLPGLEPSQGLARMARRLALGLHLNLTLGPPVLPPGEVASLVDDCGRFIRDRRRLEEAGEAREIRAELAAQAARFEAVFGHHPSHLDTHHHLHRRPRVFGMVLDLAEALGVPLRALTPEMAEQIRARRLPAADRAIGEVGSEAYWTPQALLNLPDMMEPGVTELVCHPGYADAALTHSTYCSQREVEMRALCDPRIKDALLTAGIHCITYRDLAPGLSSHG
jgi:predicted glycoside hydrolase/deacetylase ChbG (UPF0249 family)